MTQELQLGLCDNLEGWEGVGGGREVQKGGDICTYGWLMLVYGRNQHDIVKQLFFKWKQLKNAITPVWPTVPILINIASCYRTFSKLISPNTDF